MTWLTAEQQATWRAFLHATTLLEDRLDRQLQRDAGMPHTYYAPLPATSPPYGPAIFDRLTPEQTEQLGAISRIIADGLHQPVGADVPWRR